MCACLFNRVCAGTAGNGILRPSFEHESSFLCLGPVPTALTGSSKTPRRARVRQTKARAPSKSFDGRMRFQAVRAFDCRALGRNPGRQRLSQVERLAGLAQKLKRGRIFEVVLRP